MENDNNLLAAIAAAQQSTEKADELIRQYVPFIQSQTTKYLNRFCADDEDEFSVATIAFYEAIMGYERARGNFLSYATVTIRNRLIDYSRKERRHLDTVSLDTDSSGLRPIIDNALTDKRDYYEEAANVDALRREIQDLTAIMDSFGISFSDVSDNAPKQKRTLNICNNAVCYAIRNRKILGELVETRKLPLAELASGSGTSRKTLERHRKYILAMLLIQTNGYELIRGHLDGVYRKGGMSE